MPSRQPEPPFSPPPLVHRHHFHHLDLIILILAVTLLLSVLTFAFFFFHFLSRKRNATAPSDLKPPHRYSFSLLRRATSSFSTSNRLGQGGFGSVYKGTLPTGQNVAVKVMDTGTLQGEREFNNELSLATRIENSTEVLPILGFSSDNKRQRLVLVYELMSNGSLQDALLHRKPPELMLWKVRFDIAKDIVHGIHFLHHLCDPPVIHGDIKPSNILLDCGFRAKISDFGLAKVKNDDDSHVVEVVEEDGGAANPYSNPADETTKIGEGIREDNLSMMEETQSVVTGIEEEVCEGNEAVLSPENGGKNVESEASPSEMLEKGSVSEGYFDKYSVDSGRDLMTGSVSKKFGPKKSISGRDWWWKQDNNGVSESGRVKDYVMEWIGNEIKKERPKREWSSSSGVGEASTSKIKAEQKKGRKRMEWWKMYDEQRFKKKEKVRKPREWWKEEFCDELSKKSKKKRNFRSFSGGNGGELWWQSDEEGTTSWRRKRRSRRSMSSVEWWADSISGNLKTTHRNSQDWTSCDIAKSGGISSTPSMRGTVCYIAPECGGGGQPSEKCDVYSFGVLLLVLVSGRRPLQVTASPMSEFERANLISWARQLAHNGKLLDLVDPNIQSLDREQALLCITIALLCLQRSPRKRPTMKDIVGMLSGEAEPPHLPFEFSPSPPSNFPFKSRRKPR
uniref:Protein kinase domain-containing protein n=1 Tax=Kalanchoe fedtschenkoi TaxID=63787 RepID=A0A7N0UY32_KALFE